MVDRFVSSTLFSYLRVTCDHRKTNILFMYSLMKILFMSWQYLYLWNLWKLFQEPVGLNECNFMMMLAHSVIETVKLSKIFSYLLIRNLHHDWSRSMCPNFSLVGVWQAFHLLHQLGAGKKCGNCVPWGSGGLLLTSQASNWGCFLPLGFPKWKINNKNESFLHHDLPWRRVLEKLLVAQLVNKFLVLYGTWTYIHMVPVLHQTSVYIIQISEDKLVSLKLFSSL